MSTPDHGLDAFADRLHPELRAEIEQWTGDHPLERLRLILQGHLAPKPFLDACAEAMVARRLLQRGCDVRFEVSTPKGRACDFEVLRGDDRFYLHVKRLDTQRPLRRRLTISSRLRALERIQRPYVVSVRWTDPADDERMQRLVQAASEFIMRGRVGDETKVTDEDGTEIGGVRIVAPWAGTHVSLHIGLPSGIMDASGRMSRLMRRAHRQFMPRAENVILICSSHPAEHEDFGVALLGSHVERWDEFPPQGRRIAHGRAEDGLWHGCRFSESRAAGWFHFAPAASDIDVRMFYRVESGLAPRMRGTLEAVFGGTGSAPA